jgi:hypothetical protein
MYMKNTNNTFEWLTHWLLVLSPSIYLSPSRSLSLSPSPSPLTPPGDRDRGEKLVDS